LSSCHKRSMGPPLGTSRWLKHRHDVGGPLQLGGNVSARPIQLQQVEASGELLSQMDIKRWHCYGSEVHGIWSEIEPEACRNTITAELKNLRQKFGEYIAMQDLKLEELQEKYFNCEYQEARKPIQNEMKRLNKKLEALKKKFQSMVYSNNFFRGIEELLKSELGCKSWETPKDKIPFLNGVLDLTTMELKGHTPGNY